MRRRLRWLPLPHTPPAGLSPPHTTRRLFPTRRQLTPARAHLSKTFNPTTIDSPAGDRLITIPDVPTGGTLHVVTKAVAKVRARPPPRPRPATRCGRRGVRR